MRKAISRDAAAMLLATTLLSATAPVTVLAGENAPLEEITVTATRREANLIDVPISVTALSAAQLESRNIGDVGHLFRQTPGVTFRPGGQSGKTNLSIRGIFSTAGAATTALYIDDTPFQVRSTGPNVARPFYPELVGLERVEVLRGPQGTLFGAGAAGGAVRFINRDPDLQEIRAMVRSELSFTKHGSPSYALAGLTSVPLTDKLAVSSAIAYRYEGGYIDRVDTRYIEVEPDFNSGEAKSARVAATYQPTDWLTLTPSIFYQENDKRNPDAYWERISQGSDYLSGANRASPFEGSVFLPALKTEITFNKFSVFASASYLRMNYTQAVDYRTVPTALGLTASEEGAGVVLRQTVPGAFPATGDIVAPNYNTEAVFEDTIEQHVQEVRVQSNDDGPLTWLGGIFHSYNHQIGHEHLIENPETWSEVINGLPPASFAVYSLVPLYQGIYSYNTDNVTREEQTAFFGEVTYEVLNGLKLTAGLRYSMVDFEVEQTGAGPIILAITPTTSGGVQKERPLTPKAGISYEINDRNTLYVTAAKGFRPGGANPAVPATCAPVLEQLGLRAGGYDSDSVWSYEVGSKNRFFNGTLSINSSVYQIDWEGIQNAIALTGCGYFLTTNLGSARVRGGDIEVQLAPTDSLFIYGSASYTDAVYMETVLGARSPTGVQPILVNKGNKVPGRPWNLTGGAEYRFDIGEYPARVSVNASYTGRAPITVDLDPATSSYNPYQPRLGSYTQVDLNAGISVGGWDVGLYVKNLLDSTETLDGDFANEIARRQNTRVATSLRPLTAGVTATFRF